MPTDATPATRRVPPVLDGSNALTQSKGPPLAAAMSTATVTTKGQITIPADVRRRLGLEARDRVAFVETEDGFAIKVANDDVRALKGLLRTPAKPVTLAETVRRILTSRQVLLQDADVVWKALRQFATGRANFADCLIQHCADSAGCSKVVTFDRRSGMTMLR